MVSVDRQRIIETNRSLRLIKNELESLLEKGIITDDAFDSITSLLPAEASLSSTSSTPVPAPRAAPAHVAPAAAAQPHATGGGGGVSSIAARFQQNPPPAVTTAANAFSNLSLNNRSPSPAPAPAPAAAPPSYSQSTGNSSAPPPPLPGRSQPPTPAPAAPPSKPIIAHCKALYKYDASDARDCSFDKGDKIHVYEYMNADWWMGRCVRTEQEGIFPKSYVEVEAAPVQSTGAWEGQHSEKSGGYPGVGGYGAGGPGYRQPTYGGGYMAPPPGAPQGQVYDPNAPPQGEKEENKFEKHGKSIGKKFGNAAVFGAGATMGANLVNSIF
ncbi:SH3 domain-containing protein [Neurospora tetraspora]|uniref:SH3 domain-containing protein n=1 Tax=Neurospora tetraspora TaxID=94610 RepID=A0AAE0JPI4_9PEZI|nr:SH3 domain-containing protein [Neurospora tetraspora]